MEIFLTVMIKNEHSIILLIEYQKIQNAFNGHATKRMNGSIRKYINQ